MLLNTTPQSLSRSLNSYSETGFMALEEFVAFMDDIAILQVWESLLCACLSYLSVCENNIFCILFVGALAYVCMCMYVCMQGGGLFTLHSSCVHFVELDEEVWIRLCTFRGQDMGRYCICCIGCSPLVQDGLLPQFVPQFPLCSLYYSPWWWYRSSNYCYRVLSIAIDYYWFLTTTNDH